MWQMQIPRPKLKRTKFACINCKNAKAACDTQRPCAWCVRHDLQSSCVDAPRKIRASKRVCCSATNLSHHDEHVDHESKQAQELPYITQNDCQLPAGDQAIPDIAPIEDLVVPFNFGSTTDNSCITCPFYYTCVRDDTQRLICATSITISQSPVSIAVDDIPDTLVVTSDTILPITPETSSPHVQSPAIQSLSSPQQLSPPSPPQPASPAPQPDGMLQSCDSFLPSFTSQSLSPSFPPLFDETCNCQALVQREMAKIHASLETIASLMQVQSGISIPTATFRIPDTTLEDCNDEFAKALGYEGRQELLNGTENEMSDGYISKPQAEKLTNSVISYTGNFNPMLPMINQMALNSKNGDLQNYTVLFKPSANFTQIALLKQNSFPATEKV